MAVCMRCLNSHIHLLLLNFTRYFSEVSGRGNTYKVFTEWGESKNSKSKYEQENFSSLCYVETHKKLRFLDWKFEIKTSTSRKMFYLFIYLKNITTFVMTGPSIFVY